MWIYIRLKGYFDKKKITFRENALQSTVHCAELKIYSDSQ